MSRFAGHRVLITESERYLGPNLVRLFAAEGADVVADDSDYSTAEKITELIKKVGSLDTVIVNLAGPKRMMPFTKMLNPITETCDENLQEYLEELVWPMFRLLRAVLPQMIERRSGKIIAIVSAVTARAIPNLAAYSAARGAQRSLVMTVGNEVAKYNVQFNAIAPAFVENVSYFTSEMLSDQAVHDALVADVPCGAIGSGDDAAELVAALASDASNFLAGQVIPVSGGWAT